MKRKKIKIRVNEREISLPVKSPVKDAAKLIKPDSDLAILNGFPVSFEHELEDGDILVLISKKIPPSREEMEYMLTARHSPEVSARVKKAHVGIAGVGGLGSTVSVALTRLGIGTLTIVDFDTVEPSNLNRQQYYIDQIGLPKVEALASTLARINPYVEVRALQKKVTENNIKEIFNGVDILVEAFDKAEEKSMLINNALQKLDRTIIVAASGLAGYETTNIMKVHKFSERLYIVGDLKNEARTGQGLMSPRVDVAAGMQANAVLRLLLGLAPEA